MLVLLIALVLLEPDELIENPIDINHAGYYELVEIPFLRIDQIEVLLKLRPFKDFQDMVRKTKLDPITANLIKDYIYFSSWTIKRVKMSFAHTTKRYYDLYINTNKSALSVGVRDTLVKYKFSVKGNNFYISSGTIYPVISKHSERVRVYTSYTKNPGIFVDYRGADLFISEKVIYTSTPPFHNFSAFFLKSQGTAYGIIYTYGSSKANILVRMFTIKSPVAEVAAFRKFSESYFSAGFVLSGDTVESSVYFSTLMKITQFLSLKFYSRTNLNDNPRTSSFFEIFIPCGVSISYRLQGETNTLKVKNPLTPDDTVSAFLKFVDETRYGVNVEIAHKNLKGGFSLITTDESISLRESGVRYSDYVSSSEPVSKVYLIARKKVKRLELKLKLNYSRDQDLSFHFGGSYTWRL